MCIEMNDSNLLYSCKFSYILVYSCVFLYTLCTVYSLYSSSYYEVGHVVCPTFNNPLDGLADSFNVTVTISTSSVTPIMVFITAKPVENFILRYQIYTVLVSSYNDCGIVL